MDKQKLLDRIKELETSREQFRANLAAHEGAIQDCQYWLAEMDKADTPTEQKDK